MIDRVPAIQPGSSGSISGGIRNFNFFVDTGCVLCILFCVVFGAWAARQMKYLWCRGSDRSVAEWAVTCEATEGLENEQSLILQPLLSLYLRHRSFSNPSIASPTWQLILQTVCSFTYVTETSPTSSGEPHMLCGWPWHSNDHRFRDILLCMCLVFWFIVCAPPAGTWPTGIWVLSRARTSLPAFCAWTVCRMPSLVCDGRGRYGHSLRCTGTVS